MRSSRALVLSALLMAASACGGGGGGSAPVVSVPATLMSISVTPLNSSMSSGMSQQFTATGLYSNNSKKDLTGTVAWSSSDTLVATVSTNGSTIGTVATLATGTTLISATTGSVTGSTVFKVTSGGAVAPAGNVLQVTVNGSLCSPATSSSYPNKPCVEVTICSQGSTTLCQTIDDILLDTGSFGLRLFSGVVSTVPLTQIPASGGGSLAECVQYADGSSNWGPVQFADVVLGGEPAVTVPIQVIDQSFGSPPAACKVRPDTSPAQAGFNGILGVGLFMHDCGLYCANVPNNGLYYACSQSAGTWTCNPTAVALAHQAQNPVALLPVDNNGVILSLPGVSTVGGASVSGSLILGIGTESNNTPWAVTTYPASGTGDFKTTFNGTTYAYSFIDSGSNGLYFPSTMARCPGGWYCPSSLKALTATNAGDSGSPSEALSFFIGNAYTFFASGNLVFNDLGGYSAGMFDWGLPFFLGRDVYVGIEQRNSSLGTGPYWAY
jgi:hypothetical protein